MKRLIPSLTSFALLLSIVTPPAFGQSSANIGSTSRMTGSAASFEPTSFARTFTHHKANVNGIQIHYVTGGKGDPVVLLHGWPESWYMWRKVMPILAQSYTLIVPDMRGFGESSKPNTGYDKRTIAEDIYQLVRQLGYERIFLVGQDWGGPVATALAIAHPENVRKLANIEGVLPGTLPDDAFQLRTGRGSWWFAFHNAPNHIAEMLVAGQERDYLSYMIRSLMYDPTSITEADIDEYARTYAGPGGARGGFEYYRTYAVDSEFYQKAAGRKLTMPVLAIGGDASEVGGKGVIQSMQTVASNVRGVLLKQCGHYAAEERPNEITQQLFTFFKEEK